MTSITFHSFSGSPVAAGAVWAGWCRHRAAAVPPQSKAELVVASKQSKNLHIDMTILREFLLLHY